MPHKAFHEKHIKAESEKVHPGHTDGYVPHHPEPGHGDNPHARQRVELWDHSQSDCCYDKSAHAGERECFGEADTWRGMHHAHINGGTHSFHGASKQGHLRNSGDKRAHRIGKR